jgi:hypothetical protein
LPRGGRKYLTTLSVLSLLVAGIAATTSARAQYNNPRYRPEPTPVPAAPPRVSPRPGRAAPVVRSTPAPPPEAPSTATEWSFHGKAFTDLYGFMQGPRSGEILQSNFSFWPELEAKFNEQWSGRAQAAINVYFKNLRQPERTSADFLLREGYVTYQKSGWEIRAGQQIIPWGKSDGINPTDYFTAKDYTFYNPDDELRRRGELSLSLSMTPNQGDSPWNLQAVFQARYPQTRLLIPDLVIPAGLAFEKYAPESRYFHPEDMQAGVRAQYLGTGVDFSVSAFRGTSTFPQYQFNPGGGVSAPRIEAYHPQQTAFGGDLSFNLGESSTVRLETAVLLPDNGGENDIFFGLVQPHHWDTVLGLERAFGEAWRVTGQFFVRYHLVYREPELFNDGNPVTTGIQQSVGRANALVLNFPARTVPGTTLRVAYADPSSAWTVEAFLVGYFTEEAGYLFRPSIGYKPLDDLKLTAGAEIYGGDPEQTLGALRDRSAMFGEVKYFW